MKLEKLKLTNFRGFRELEITFDPSFTVLLGANMAGKTAVLDSAAVALSTLLEKLDAGPHRSIEDDEIYRIVERINEVPELQPQLPAKIQAWAKNDEVRLNWARVRDDGTKQTRSKGDIHFPLPAYGDNGQPSDLPVIAHYGTQRSWPQSSMVEERRGVGSRYDGYACCFHSASSYPLLVSWMRKQTLVQLQRGGGYIQPQLAAVESAVKSCIDDVTRFWFDVQYDELRIEHTAGDIQSFAMLSEGVRNMVAMIADIAWRASVLNPQHGPEAHLRSEGVVLIDELDLHLHPAWQRRIVGDLRRTFPKIQFIVTTHSPQIVASVSRKQIRLLNNNRLIAEEPYVEGRDANEILEDVFGVTSRPDAVQAEIDALYRLIEDEDFAAARTRLAALQERLGPDDTAMIKARWVLETEDPRPSTEPPPSP